MSRTIETQVFQFSELSDDAKENARDWFRSCIESEEIGEFVIDDATRIAAMMGIEFDSRPVRLMNGQTRQEPCVNWSGFGSQGDGASFTGRYNYEKASVQSVMDECPDDKKLHQIAASLAKLQKRFFYQLHARITVSGRYSHSGTMDIEVTDKRDDYRDVGTAQDEIAQLMRDFADWIYSQLEKQNDYLYSEENVDESIKANEYEFTADGEIV